MANMPTPSRSYSPSAAETLRVALLALATTATTSCSVSEQILDTLRDTALGRALGLRPPISLGGDPIVSCDLDSDGDGLSDRYELEIGTDPYDSDTDGDGLSDGEEVKTYGTDPLNPDSDNDDSTDGEEVKTLQTNPLEPNSADEPDTPAS